MVSSQNFLPSPVVELCHSVIVTSPPSLPSPLSCEHAVMPAAKTNTAEVSARVFLTFMNPSSSSSRSL